MGYSSTAKPAWRDLHPCNKKKTNNSNFNVGLKSDRFDLHRFMSVLSVYEIHKLKGCLHIKNALTFKFHTETPNVDQIQMKYL